MIRSNHVITDVNIINNLIFSTTIIIIARINNSYYQTVKKIRRDHFLKPLLTLNIAKSQTNQPVFDGKNSISNNDASKMLKIYTAVVAYQRDISEY